MKKFAHFLTELLSRLFSVKGKNPHEYYPEENHFSTPMEVKKPLTPTSPEKNVPTPIFTPKTPIGIEQYKNENIDNLICGLAWAESRSTRDKINYNTIGDLNIKDHAYGYLQIRIGVLSQVNQLWGTKYKVEDLLGEEGAKLSYKVCKDYLLKVVPQYKSFKLALKEGVPLFEIYAKSWNGGPGFYSQSLRKGYENYAKGLSDYWLTVQKGMK